MRNLLNRLKFIKACFAVIKNPHATDQILASVSNLKPDEKFLPVQNKIYSDLRSREYLKDREIFKYPSLDELQKYEEGTLGKLLYEYLFSNNFDPYYFKQSGEDEISFIRNHVRTTHDLWHIVTGYKTTVKDELALQGFTFGQLHAPGSVLIISLLLLHFLFYHPRELPAAFESLVEGYERGKKSSQLFGVRWKEYYSMPAVTLSRQLEIPPRMI